MDRVPERVVSLSSAGDGQMAEVFREGECGRDGIRPHDESS